VIHVITRTGADRTRGSVSTGAGTYGRRDASAELTGGGERAGFSFGLARSVTDGILPFNNRHVNTLLSGAMVLRPDDATSADLTVRLGERRYHYPTDGSGAVVDRNAFTYGDEVVVGLRGSRRLGDRLAVRATFGVSDNDGGADDAQDGPGDTSGSFGYVSLDAVRRASADVRLDLRSKGGVTTLGAEWEQQRQRSFNESLSEWGNSAGQSEYSRWNRAVYAHLAGERGMLAYNAGGRVEDNERFGRFVTWQAGMVLRLGNDGRTRMRASAGSAIKEPTFYENYATGFALGNPDLGPERSVGLEAGVEQRLAGGRVRVSATLFQQRFEDLIQFTFAPASPGGPNFYNVAEARARGLEVETWARLGSVSLTAAWTRLDSDVLDAGFDEGPGATFVEGEALLRRPSNTLALRASAVLGRRVSLSAGATRVGTRSDRDFSTWPAAPVELEAYTDVSAGAEVPVLRRGNGAPRLTLTFRGDNLLDREYQEAFGFAAPGRAIYAGARLTFGGP
jgi:vitamin B12 transporter